VNKKIGYLLLDAYHTPPDSFINNNILSENTRTLRYEFKNLAPIEDDPDTYVMSSLYSLASQFYYLMHKGHKISFDQALNTVKHLYYYTKQAVSIFNPHIVLIWCEFYAPSRVAQFACDLLQKKTAFLEHGPLPGTTQLDFVGQMGESWVARNPRGFNKLEINAKDIEQARIALNYFKYSELNTRKQSAHGKLKPLLSKVDKKILFFAGHNHHSSGIFPYEPGCKNMHSPLYMNSWQAFNSIVKIAKQNNWFIVYKPHPVSDERYSNFKTRTEDYIIVNDANIYECVNCCDVLLTVLSNVSHLGLIRGKPVVMLGYTQLVGKGCTYDAFDSNRIADKIKEALHSIDHNEKYKNWEKYVARLLKYYLFAYDSLIEQEFNIQNPADFCNKILYLSGNCMSDYELMTYNKNKNKEDKK
jgi:hypothetical protein